MGGEKWDRFVIGNLGVVARPTILPRKGSLIPQTFGGPSAYETTAFGARRGSGREKPFPQEQSARFVVSQNRSRKPPILSISDLSALAVPGKP